MSCSYTWVRRWGELLGSNQWYVDLQVERAQAENAPVDAIYRHHDGGWATLGDVKNEGTLRMFRERGWIS